MIESSDMGQIWDYGLFHSLAQPLRLMFPHDYFPRCCGFLGRTHTSCGHGDLLWTPVHHCQWVGAIRGANFTSYPLTFLTDIWCPFHWPDWESTQGIHSFSRALSLWDHLMWQDKFYDQYYGQQCESLVRVNSAWRSLLVNSILFLY